MERRRDGADTLRERVDRRPNVGDHLLLHRTQRLDDVEHHRAIDGGAPHGVTVRASQHVGAPPMSAAS